MQAVEALILGVVEGLTEFVPVSSTGHLILAGHWLGLGATPEAAAAVDAFDIVIQAGAWLAAVLYYAPLLRNSVSGAIGDDADARVAGRRLIVNLAIAFVPVMIVGLLARKWIKAWLFGPLPVACALAVGGVAMIVAERWARTHRAKATVASLAAIDARLALQVGLWQCLALVPGTSRSMATMLGGMLGGMSAKVAADFSFLLAIPVLGAATAYELLKEWALLRDVLGLPAIALGLAASFAIGWASIAIFLKVVVARGLWPFGLYRVALAALVWWTLIRPGAA